jgi:hypothetical protein
VIGEPLDDKIKELLKELGNAINESISGSREVNDRIQKIRDEGYDLYVVLDATIGLGKNDEEECETQYTNQLALKPADAQFRINVADLSFLRSVGIDPTRKVKVPKRIESKPVNTDSES